MKEQRTTTGGVTVYFSTQNNGEGCRQKKSETQPPMGVFPLRPRSVDNNAKRRGAVCVERGCHNTHLNNAVLQELVGGERKGGVEGVRSLQCHKPGTQTGYFNMVPPLQYF